MSKRTGVRCTQWAVHGSTVCWHHGGANSAVRRKGDVNISLAQVDTIERRHPHEVMLDALHLHDVAVREDHARLATREANGEDVGDDRDQLLERNEMRLHMASRAIVAGAAEQATEAYMRHLELEGQIVGLALEAVVRELTRSLGDALGHQLQVWAWTQAHSVLVAAQDGIPDQPPDVEPPPFALAAIVDDARNPARSNVDDHRLRGVLAQLDDDDFTRLVVAEADRRGI